MWVAIEKQIAPLPASENGTLAQKKKLLAEKNWNLEPIYTQFYRFDLKWRIDQTEASESYIRSLNFKTTVTTNNGISLTGKHQIYCLAHGIRINRN